MGLGGWASLAERYRRGMILLALVSTFAGVALVIDRPKGTVLEWLALPFLVVGAGLFAWGVWPRGMAPAEAAPSLARALLRWLTWRGRLVPFFPAIGVAILALDVAYNFLVASTATFGTEDTIVILLASALIGYGFVPARFARERDFVLVFFVMLNAILVVPLLMARAVYADFERSVNVYSWVALAPQTSAVLSFLGVNNSVHSVSGSTAPGLTFGPKNISVQVTIVITTACSGIYSFGIFAAAFIAFVLTEYEKLSGRIWAMLAFGFVTAYAANVLRMVAIILIGYYTDTEATELQNMLIAHSYAGWLIFLGWISLFWGVLLKIIQPKESGFQEARPRRQATCGVCANALTPLVPAIRCSCGAYYHVACLVRGPCPLCGSTTKPEMAPLEMEGSALSK